MEGNSNKMESLLTEINQLDMKGNIIPHAWLTKITFNNGKPDLLGMFILADIIYWYRPIEVRDENTGALIGLKKKFKRDMLQRSIQSFAEQLGVSRRQVSDALKRLSEKNLIVKELREIETPMGRLGNVLFLAPNIENIAKLQTGIPLMQSNVQGGDRNNDVYPLCNQTHKGIQSNAQGHVIKRGTYTKNTTKITTEKKAARKKSKACHEGIDNLAKEDSIAAAISLHDALIGQTLTDKQIAIVEQAAKELKSKISISKSVKDFTEEIKCILLNPTCFKKTGKDFTYKLNAIKQSFRKGQWTSQNALKMITSTIESNPEYKINQQIKTIQNEILSLKGSCLSFESAMQELPHDDKAIESFARDIKKRHEIIRAKQRMLSQLEKVLAKGKQEESHGES